MRALMRFAASRINVRTYERLMAHSILKKAFNGLKLVPSFENREALWDDCIAKRVKDAEQITYVEFGVHAGYSIKYFAQRNLNRNSTFIGLDSFEGLPEDWGALAKGTFDTKGTLPKIDDHRVSFIKGWFQNTWNELAARIAKSENLIVHYDADLYSSTLFALSKVDSLDKEYIAIFDEFAGHEARALYNYLQAYNASVVFLGKTVIEGYPVQVMCKIDPNKMSNN